MNGELEFESNISQYIVDETVADNKNSKISGEENFAEKNLTTIDAEEAINLEIVDNKFFLTPTREYFSEKEVLSAKEQILLICKEDKIESEHYEVATKLAQGGTEPQNTKTKIQVPTKNCLQLNLKKVRLPEFIGTTINNFHSNNNFLVNCYNSEIRYNEKNEVKEQQNEEPDKLFNLKQYCQICELHQENKTDIKALCLEYPPYKKCKILDLKNINLNKTRPHEKYSVKMKEIYINQNKHFLDNQVVPQHPPKPSQIEDTSNGPSFLRPIRLGLSKRAKPRPLHRASKF